MAMPAEVPTDALEKDVDAAIAACDGDLRAAVRALVIANSLLWQELNDATLAACRGYVRRRKGG